MQGDVKKTQSGRTTYAKKSLPLPRCKRLINCITLKSKKKMKKLVLMAAAMVAISFASCGNKAADAEQARQDSIRIADSLKNVEAQQAAAAAAADSTAADSTATAATEEAAK